MPRPTPPRLDLVVAVSAVVISLCALGVSVYEARVLRSQERAAVWPYVEVGARYTGDGFALVARNQGTGPARVREVRVSRGARIYGDWDEVVDEALVPTYGPDHGVTYALYRTSGLARSVLSPGEERVLFAVPWTDTTRALVDRVGDLRVDACYCSVLGECWTVGRGEEPTPGRCAMP